MEELEMRGKDRTMKKFTEADLKDPAQFFSALRLGDHFRYARQFLLQDVHQTARDLGFKICWVNDCECVVEEKPNGSTPRSQNKQCHYALDCDEEPGSIACGICDYFYAPP